MLIACHACARQYDVGDLEPGRKIRCACGELNVIPEPQVREAPMQRCASCGGELAAGDTHCGYCDAAVTIQDRGWGESCPSCYARLVRDAKFCSACGTGIQAQTVRKSPTDQRCPRCEGALAVCEIPGGHFTECTGCGGVWLEEGSFEQVTAKRDESSAVTTYFTTPDRITAAAKAERVRDVAYLKCPTCGGLMNRKNFARCSGVIIDWCRGHGYWFDAHELEQIMEFVSRGGLDKARSKQIEEQKLEVRKAEAQVRRARAQAARSGRGSPMVVGMGLGTPRGTGGLLGYVLGGLLGGLFDS
ncbi:MAG: zf-TFIIB domain-containing protein [Planctomycetes bacterium]|nr:zf-TFIIB domain-containing protein [Planctomycetota bacterium]